MAAITRSAVRRRQLPEFMQEEVVQKLRIERIKRSQDKESWITKLKEYLIGDINHLNNEEAKLCVRIAPDYEVDESVLLFFCPRSADNAEGRMELLKLVIPELLQQDFLHHYHTSVEGDNKGVGRTYQKIRSNVHWRGLYRSSTLR